jgi:hypothetical protein
MSRRLACALAILVWAVGPALADDKTNDWAQPLADLYSGGKLFDKGQYKAVRAAFTRAFELRHDKLLRAAYGPDFEALNEWLSSHADVMEDFYSALDERHDNLPAALRLFHDLWKKSPDDVAKYPNLAIATAVVWDDPRRGVYDYRGHQVRTHSTLPEAVMKFTGLDDFDYLVTHARQIQGKENGSRLQILPWEFLVYVVDHRTPADERDWALKNYIAKRPMIGKIYGEIEYDHEMLRTNSKVCKLAGEPYTLPSIRKHGGVCAMQADFAARVAKSLAVPAAYVGGEGVSGVLHAWVMWVEVHGAAKGQISFTLESHGRYRIDQYYTGHTIDPQTGEQILDRDMERRLWAVAHDRGGKRLADLLMRAYPALRERLGFTAKQRMSYLNRVLQVSHYNEGVWLELMAQVKAGDLSAEDRQAVLTSLDGLLKSYAKYPDFTWRVAPALAAAHKSAAARNEVYQQLVRAYEAAGRPDLACQARLKWADYHFEQKHWLTTAKGLRQTIDRFPAEGRYVPKMMTKLQDVCAQFKDGNSFLSKFYLGVLARIPPTRGDEPSQYCISMYEQAITFYKEQKRDKTAADLEAQLRLVKAGKKKSG